MAKAKGSKRDFREEIEFPSDINVIAEHHKLIMKKGSNEVRRVLEKDMTTSIEGNKIIIEVKSAGRQIKRRFGTLKSHIRNMIEGLTKEYEYELEICNVHFPITVLFDKAKQEFSVKNMLGEKTPRKVGISKNVEVEIKAPHIKLKSFDLEAAGQAAANLEKITKIRNRDRNKFQDGIFITKKPGKVY